MQACRVLRNSAAAARTSASIHSFSFPHVCPKSRARSFADTASDPQATGKPEQSFSRKRVSVLLQNTVSLLPRTLSTADGAGGPDSSIFWSNILERSLSELSSPSDQLTSKATVAVSGFDKWARSHDLVTALLEDPFTSDPTYSDILRNRWKNAPSFIRIEYGRPAAFAGELSSPSDWFQRFLHPIQLTEFPDLSSLSSISDEMDSFLLDSDVLVLLCDPIATPLSDLALRAKHLLDKHNTVLVLTSVSMSDSRRQSVSRTLSKIGCQPGHVLFVDPGQALDAVTALQANPTSPSTIDKYQRDTLASRISTVAAAIDEVLGSKSSSGTFSLGPRQGTALSQVHGSLRASFRSVEAMKQDVDHVTGKIAGLSTGIQRIREDAGRDIFSKSEGDNKVEKALSLGSKEMNALLGALTFWKMVWRVDEIGALVSAAVQGQWCQGLEHQLILQTGRLESIQREMSTSAFSLTSASASPSLRSHVLENQLEQLECAPSHTLTTTSLTHPIHERRSQLIRFTTTRLHREAQSAVVGAFGGVLSGAGLGWWLAFGEHILSLGVSTEMGTAIGSGALLAVSSVRWAVGKWERAKKRWTRDSARIGEGLARDLETTVQRTVDEKVTIVASTACKGMQDLVDRRHREVSQLQGELCDLDTELHACAQFPASWAGQRSRPVTKIDMD